MKCLFSEWVSWGQALLHHISPLHQSSYILPSLYTQLHNSVHLIIPSAAEFPTIIVSDIPQDVIFLDASRLSSKGFRWAPATLRMPIGTENLFSQLFWEMDKSAGLRGNDGLRVEFYGFLFKYSDGVPSFGDLIAKEKLAEYKFTDQSGNFYTSQSLTNEFKIGLSEYRGLAHTDNSSSLSPRARPFRLTDGARDIYTLPRDITSSTCDSRSFT